MKVNENTILRGTLVIVSLSAISIALVLSRYNYQIEKKLSQELKNISVSRDSLQKEHIELYEKNFECETTLGRYELSLDHLKEVNPKAANQFEDYMYTQTE